MALALACVPAAPKAKKDFCRIDVTEAPANDDTAWDKAVYPSEPELRYYLTFSVDGAELGRSYVFAPNPSDGSHTFNNYIFPVAGSWTVALCNVADDSVAKSLSVTVS